jgi:chemotaxis signal transduction protein
MNTAPDDNGPKSEHVEARSLFGDQAIQRLLDQPILPDDMQEATDRVARALQPPDKHVQRLLVFQLCGQLFAVAAKSVSKVTHAVPVHRIPHRTNALIRGLCHVDGDLLLCADLKNLLEIGSPVSESTQRASDPPALEGRRMIVLQEQARLWTVEVDAVEGVLAVIPEDLQTPPLTVDSRTGHFTANVVRQHNQLVAVLDLPGVLMRFQAALS